MAPSDIPAPTTTGVWRGPHLRAGRGGRPVGRVANSAHGGLPEAFNAMAAWLGQWELRGTGHWALEEKDSGRFVGSAGLKRPEHHDRPGVEVGWTLHPSQWGRGYATEAGAEAVRYGFEELG